MRTPEIIALKLEPAIKECRLHLRRLEYALGRLESKFPLIAREWQTLDDETVADIDQLLFRYNKLQDAIGQRLFPAILNLGGEWREDETFIDFRTPNLIGMRRCLARVAPALSRVPPASGAKAKDPGPRTRRGTTQGAAILCRVMGSVAAIITLTIND